MSSQTLLIVLIAVAFLIVLIALLADDPNTAVDEVGAEDAVAPAPVAVDTEGSGSEGIDRASTHPGRNSALDRGHVQAEDLPPLGEPVSRDATTDETTTVPVDPWLPPNSDEGDIDDARRAAGLPPTPDR